MSQLLQLFVAPQPILFFVKSTNARNPCCSGTFVATLRLVTAMFHLEYLRKVNGLIQPIAHGLREVGQKLSCFNHGMQYCIDASYYYTFSWPMGKWDEWLISYSPLHIALASYISYIFNSLDRYQTKKLDRDISDLITAAHRARPNAMQLVC
jgi:hypothetical protein